MRQRLLKSLRIAVTAVSLLVCGLLIVLWMRSYTHWDLWTVRLPISNKLAFRSCNGSFDISLPRPHFQERWFGERWGISQNGIYLIRITAPFWFWLTIFATIAALPWIKWRFSLRTLLIVLTLFAVFFGAIAMSMRG